MSIIGIDLGNKKVGIALFKEGIIIPREIVPRIKIINYLKNIFKEEKNIDIIVVGLPYDIYGKKTKQLEKTSKFIEKLKIIFPLKKIIGVDERYTSIEAKNILKNMGIKYKNPKEDSIAASLILESYIKIINN